MIRNASAGQVMVVVVFAHDNPAAGENHQARTALLEALSEAFPQITSLYHMVNTKETTACRIWRLSIMRAKHTLQKPWTVCSSA